MEPVAPAESASPPPSLPWREALLVWIRVAALSFGGPAGQIAVMHRIVVDEKRWVDERRFLHALNYCTLLPGPEATQLATYIGWMFHGPLGGLMAGGLFVLPGFVSLLILSLIYVYGIQTTLVAGLFFGLKPAVLAVVVEALLRIGRRALKSPAMWWLSAASFVAIFFFRVPFPAIVAAAALLGLLAGRYRPDWFPSVQRSTAGVVDERPALIESLPPKPAPTHRQTLLTALVWLSIWFVPLSGLALWLGRGHVLVEEGLFFSRAAVVTFGGAYAVLSYLAQQAVERYGWLTAGEMLDGLGLCETTPGPLIQVVQFVAFLGAFRDPAPFSPLTAAILGSLVATWATFVPCFFWIFLGAPYVERLRGNLRLSAALTAVTAAVVGVILNLAVWFTLQTLFGKVDVVTIGRIHLTLQVPEWNTLSIPSLVLAVLAFVMMFVFHRGMLLTLAVCASAGALWMMLGPALVR